MNDFLIGIMPAIAGLIYVAVIAVRLGRRHRL
jgi:hypothetical protein